jgi:hypothetical protein
MPLVVNGVTIPQNVANALMVKGVSIKQVIANGMAVWSQSLLNAIWSGDSVAGFIAFLVSGNLFRGSMSNVASPWNVANSDGTFTQATTPVSLFQVLCSNNSIWCQSGYAGYTPPVFFTKGSGFTGGVSTSPTAAWFLETSSGLLRQRANNNPTGAWISLTIK